MSDTQRLKQLQSDLRKIIGELQPAKKKRNFKRADSEYIIESLKSSMTLSLQIVLQKSEMFSNETND